MNDKGDKIVIGENSKYPIDVTCYVYKGQGKSDVDTVIEDNFKAMTSMIKKEHYAVPMMFVYAKDRMFVVPLSMKLASDTKSSAADQVVPLLKTFKLNEDKTGEIIGYQVIFEAWMGRTNIDESKKLLKNYKFGDISKMEQRVDAVVNVISINKKELKTELYELQKLELEKKVKLKRMGNDWKMPTTNPKFPNFKDIKVEY